MRKSNVKVICETEDLFAQKILVFINSFAVITTFFFFIVGSPILVDKVENPSMEQISELHSKYKDELRELFENHRDACGVPRNTELVIQ